MKAVRYYRYGSAEVLGLEDVDPPAVGDDDVLVRVRAAAVNPLDFHFMRGLPYLMRAQAGLSRPKAAGLGTDLAGTVEAVGRNVTGFRAGDEVFGARDIDVRERRLGGAFAEYVSIGQRRAVLRKPANLTFEQAAAIPVAALTALQALRDKGRLRPGHQVLVNGAAGGVGTFAVQIAKAHGAEVTGVCGTRNAELVRSIGADRVIDYTREDLTAGRRRYDLILDNVGNHSMAAFRRLLTPRGTLVANSGSGGPLLGGLSQGLTALALSPFVRHRLIFFIATLSLDDLVVLRDLAEAGKITPVVDRTYPLAGVPDAVRHLEQGHARGKVVITV